MQHNSHQILVIIPAFNEELRVAQVVKAASVFLPVLVVDDGSSDGTAQIAETAGARVLSQSVNQGKGAALRTGFKYALEENYSAAITLDADGQHDPAEIPDFMHHFQTRGGELIIGKRDFRHMPLSRRLANNLGAVSTDSGAGKKK